MLTTQLVVVFVVPLVLNVHALYKFVTYLLTYYSTLKQLKYFVFWHHLVQLAEDRQRSRKSNDIHGNKWLLKCFLTVVYCQCESTCQS